MVKTVLILGATGSVGQSTLQVIKQHPDKFQVKTLVAHRNAELLAQQTRQFSATNAVLLDVAHRCVLQESIGDTDANLYYGMADLLALIDEGHDIVVSAITGIAGLQPTLAAIGKCSLLALANKESLVCAGSLLMKHPLMHLTKLIPLDSEHNAIFQALQVGGQLCNITLTASGGPFWRHSLTQMRNITVQEAVQHPNWQMGSKISIDSATMFNKGLELIEAMYLFSLPAKQIEILVHPQSIIHGMVSYDDGTTIAHLSRPNMQVPIAYALRYPERLPILHQTLDLASLGALTFEEPDLKRFPMLHLAMQVAQSDGQAPKIIANCANEAAVHAFLQERISFLDIHKVVSQTLEQAQSTEISCIEDILQLQQSSESLALRIIEAM